MGKNAKKKTSSSVNKIYPLLLLVATLFMGIGYATINSITLNLSGKVSAKVQDGIYITSVIFDEENSNQVVSQEVSQVYKTMLTSNISLSNINESKLVYDITIYNSNDINYYFDSVSYLKTDDDSTYTNQNIKYDLIGIEEGTILKAKDSITFSLVFSYDDINNITMTDLKSDLYFNFKISSYVVNEYGYTKKYEKFIAPHDGLYKLEVWGSQGQSSTYSTVLNEGGYGGYSVGEIILKKNDILYVAVGGNTKDDNLLEGGFNGGGYTYVKYVGCGGGATSIYDSLIADGQLQNYINNISNILIVAGGGGGGQTYQSLEQGVGNYSGQGGHGGGYIGGNGTPNTSTVYGYGMGGTQTAGGGSYIISMPPEVNSVAYGSFGKGATLRYYFELVGSYLTSSGGGGGFYGGGSIEHGPAGGGSGYIQNSKLSNKYMVCYNCATSSEEKYKTISNYNVSETALSDYSKKGTGYAKITFLSE